ncbi:phage holin family protein [Reichenbachiella ulvae]|uniref:Phage holin family protein n=1 Tax=Reichenbachiella ulvae TaxID=2980104 RepID=A0ABT3CW24_9BACT|nr:phage holin family protein [Reichenbachiella ulvae]MCV9387910.1 phage holin family protein [Reichenbachiella ulvae]
MIDILKITKLKEALSDYVKVKLELFKIDMTEQISHVLAQVIAYIVILLIATLVILFVSMGMAFLINEQLESEYLGFLVVAATYLIVLLFVFYLLRSGKMKLFFEDKMLESIQKNKKEKSDEE